MDHLLQLTHTAGSGSTALTVTLTGDGEDNRDVSVGANGTDVQVNLGIDVSALKSLYITCDKDVSIETNDGSSPDDTLTITANKPLVWYDGCGLDNPLGTDVTALFVTRTGGGAGTGTGTLKIRVLQDATP